MKTKFIKTLPLFISCSVIAAGPDSFPDSFELVCDRVYVVGHEEKNISSSYISWNRDAKSLAIKSEELNEYKGALTPDNYEVFSAHKDDEETTVIELTFKQLSTTEKWRDQNSTKIVALELKSPNESNNALIKLSDFSVKYGVVQDVTTKHATCNLRDLEPLISAEVNDFQPPSQPPEDG